MGRADPPKTAASRRTIPLRPEVATELERWRQAQSLWAEHLGEDWNNTRGLVFTTRTGRPISHRNISRAFHRAREAAGVDHGSLKTFRSTVATQLAERGLHPSKTQAFLGHAHVTTTMTYYTAVSDVINAAAYLPDLDLGPVTEPPDRARSSRGNSRGSCASSRKSGSGTGTAYQSAVQ